MQIPIAVVEKNEREVMHERDGQLPERRRESEQERARAHEQAGHHEERDQCDAADRAFEQVVPHAVQPARRVLREEPSVGRRLEVATRAPDVSPQRRQARPQRLHRSLRRRVHFAYEQSTPFANIVGSVLEEIQSSFE